MGQKINPISLRIGGTRGWTSRWFFPAKTNTPTGRYPYAKLLEEDETVRRVIRERIAQAGVSGIDIERTSNSLRVLIKAARPGFIIGQGGKGIGELNNAIVAALHKLRGKEATGKKNAMALSVNVEELKRSEVSAVYIAQQMAWDLEKRMPFRRTMKKYIDQVMQNKEVKGAKILAGGRLDGAEIARHESTKQGQLPLQTLRTDIDYGTATALTTFGTIGIKVWIYKGEVFEKDKQEVSPRSMDQDARPSRDSYPRQGSRPPYAGRSASGHSSGPTSRSPRA
jgi:small subunit ribosomal protein S3